MTGAAWLRLVEFVKAEEGLRLDPYRDVAGCWTVGYGRRVDAGHQPIARDEAEEMLAADLRYALAFVPDLPWIGDAQRIALASFVFNVGGTAFVHSTMRRKLLAGDMAGAAAEFGRWVYARVGDVPVVVKGLVARRGREQAIFREGQDHGLEA